MIRTKWTFRCEEGFLMAHQTGSHRSSSSYDIYDDPVVEEVDEILDKLQPYPHLDLIREVFVTAVKLAREDCNRGDLKILRSSIKELRYAFKVFASYRNCPKVSIFGSARSRKTNPEYKTSQELGRRMAQSGYMVITGAGGGIMEAANIGAGRELSFGLNIMLPFEQSANEIIKEDPKLINFRYFFTRKLFFVKESNAVVLLPGGVGTMDEGFETLTLLQTGRSEPIPIVMLDSPSGTYWKDWHKFVRTHLFGGSYVSPEDEALFLVTNSVEAAYQEIMGFYRRYHSSRYVDRKRKLVVRLKSALSDQNLEDLNQEFEDILSEGQIENCEPFPEESDEMELLELKRLSLSFNRQKFGRLRQLIDRINQL